MAKPLNFEPDPQIRCRDFKIGCIGAGFIMADVQLSAYTMARFPVIAIASRRVEKAAEVANRWKIPTVHQTPRQLIEDPDVEIVDIAFPARSATRINPARSQARACARHTRPKAAGHGF